MNKKKTNMQPEDAADFADDINLPDGAADALAAEFAGMEYDDYMMELAALAEDEEEPDNANE